MKEQLFEVFIRPHRGLDHRHVGSVYAADARQALQVARDCYLRRREGSSLWVINARDIETLDPSQQEDFVEPLDQSDYRHASNYKLPKEVDSM